MNGERVHGDWLEPKTVERFWRKTRQVDGHVLWVGAVSPSSGVGVFRVPALGKNMSARRVAYALAHGRTPEKLMVGVTCAHNNCVKHLRLSQTPNITHVGVVTWDLVGEIRARKDEPYADLATAFGISSDQVMKILRNLTWHDPTFERAEHHRASNTRLTKQIVVEARERVAAGESIASVAKAYDIAFVTMLDAVKGRTWKWVGHTPA